MFTIIYNSVCRESSCEFYIEWEFENGFCISCTKVGQSYDIVEFPDDCKYKERLEKWKDDHEKDMMWNQLSHG